MKTISPDNITAVILAGGRGRRMGGEDKGLLEFEGRTIVEALIASLHQQGLEVLINANRNQTTYQSYGVSVIADQLTHFQGPLAGFAAAMHAVQTDYILTLPCDGPLLADDFVARFIDTQSRENTALCIAHDGERLQPVHALMQVSLSQNLQAFLRSGQRKIDQWYAQHQVALVDFSAQRWMFKNINSPEDKQALLDMQRL